MNYLIEAILTVATLSGYFMVLNGLMFLGAIVASIANVFNIFYAVYKNLLNIIIINSVMLVINIIYIAKNLG